MKEGKNHTLISMIMGRILIMLGVIVLLTFVMITAMNYRYAGMDVWARIDHFMAEAQDAVQSGKYARLKKSHYLHKGDSYDVVDENGTLLYSSTGRTENYDTGYLSFIPSYEKNEGYTLYDLSDGGYLLVHDQDNGIAAVTVLDEARNVLYTTSGSTIRKLSEKIMKLLEDNENLMLQKYGFTAEDGTKCWLLLQLDETALQDKRKTDISGPLIIAAYAFCIILTVLIGGYTLTKRVTGPIYQLEEGMEHFSEGGRELLEEIKGPREVVSAVHTFNHMNEAIVKAEEDKQKLAEEKRRMTADLSHDLKTPVTVIQGYLDAMQDGLIPPEQYPKYLKTMSDKMVLLADLINQISTYNRLDHPDVKLHFSMADLSEFVRSYFAARYSEMDTAGHEITADIPEERMMAELDRTQMSRVLDNLVNNSLKYTPEGTHFFVLLRKEGDQAVLLCGDDGPGIDPQLAPHIFEPFIMGDASRTTGSGSGLGLSIAHSIVEKHHGIITLARTEDIAMLEKSMDKKIVHGTFFRIFIPLVEEERKS